MNDHSMGIDPTIPDEPDSLVGVGDAAFLFFGTRNEADRARVRRLVDRGEVGSIRVGTRGDRLIPRSEIRRLFDAAIAQRRSVT